MTTHGESTSTTIKSIAQQLIEGGYRKTPISEAVATFVGSLVGNYGKMPTIMHILQANVQKIEDIVPKKSDATK